MKDRMDVKELVQEVNPGRTCEGEVKGSPTEKL
jgi:hypothetical protein